MYLKLLSRFIPLEKYPVRCSLSKGVEYTFFNKTKGLMPRPSFLTGFIISLLNFYQEWISINLPRSCRFFPSCSEYARQAILKYGVCRGMIIALCRISKCHPFSGKQGFDPVR